MKRRWVYPGEIPRTLDILTMQRNALTAISKRQNYQPF